MTAQPKPTYLQDTAYMAKYCRLVMQTHVVPACNDDFMRLLVDWISIISVKIMQKIIRSSIFYVVYDTVVIDTSIYRYIYI